MITQSYEAYLKKHKLNNTLYNRISYTLEKVNGKPATPDEVNTIFDELFTKSQVQYLGVKAIENYLRNRKTRKPKEEGNLWLMHKNIKNY